MSKLRHLVFSQEENNPIKRKSRYLTQPGEPKHPKLLANDRMSARMQFIKSISSPKQKDHLTTSHQLKEKLFNKNFSQYKQIFDSEKNVESFPFIITLRQSKKQPSKANSISLTNIEPFQVAQKETINQKIKKDVSSIAANRRRVFQAAYRWKKHSGVSVRVSCQFESSLRASCENKSHQQANFANFIKPPRYKNIESKRYNLKDLVCQHQKKILQVQ